MRKRFFALFVVILFGCGSRDAHEILVLSVGQGDSVAIRSGQTTILIDTGPGSSAETLLKQNLRRYRIEPDLVVLTHPDEDHTGGVPFIARRFPNLRYVINEAFRDHPDLQATLREAGIRPQQIDWLTGSAMFRRGSFRVTFSSPSTAETVALDNARSIMTQVRDGTARAVFIGDAPIATEAQWARNGVMQADLLLAGHHGSRFSTSEAWLDAVRPAMVAISCGRDNRYGHPSPEVLERLAARQIPVYRTDRQGTLTFRVVEGRYRFAGAER